MDAEPPDEAPLSIKHISQKPRTENTTLADPYLARISALAYSLLISRLTHSLASMTAVKLGHQLASNYKVYANAVSFERECGDRFDYQPEKLHVSAVPGMRTPVFTLDGDEIPKIRDLAMASELSRRREPMIETIELAGRIITLREASIEDAERILQMSREVCGPWDYLPSALFPLFNHPRARIYVAEHEQQIISVRFDIVSNDSRTMFGGGVRTHSSFRRNSLPFVVLRHSFDDKLRDNIFLRGVLIAVKTPDLIMTHAAMRPATILHRWKMIEFELRMPNKRIECINQMHLVKEKAEAILHESSSALFPDNIFLHSYLWIPCEPSRLSLADAYSSTNTLFYFSGPDRLSGVAFFDAVSAEAGTLATVFCYTSRDSDSQLVFEMLQSVPFGSNICSIFYLMTELPTEAASDDEATMCCHPLLLATAKQQMRILSR
ncbi:hypothetical protein CAPTEDRAFT_219993 [Capitella teleta]|uniref:Uncharacterized protein n=1 Tax=Capitella teleta TaxID=283909 RepID=R7T9M7_CAPTE|nr:hypothetical protein CAPTEDRAFT_219993 [Capitella teleta]|eukprot:ELT87679.1 hypothetical protein CAPTEDRAFT_219993 [Capitella teleta]